jgi:hypothetical protein
MPAMRSSLAISTSWRTAAITSAEVLVRTTGGGSPWETFRADIEAVVLRPKEMRKSSAGRKPLDAIVLFRMLILQALHNLSDEQAEYQMRDRLSFTRFLRLGIEDSIPDATTLWLFREKLAKAGLIEKLFERSTSISLPKATWRVVGDG